MDCKGTQKLRYMVVNRGVVVEVVDGNVIHERLVSIFVNWQEVATIMCTPCEQEELALGFLANEGIISGLDEVGALDVCPAGDCVDVLLTRGGFEAPRRLIRTSGCGGGTTFDDLSREYPPLEDTGLRVTPAALWVLMDRLYAEAKLYSEARGVHNAALSDGESLLALAEDVGRHNTLDKIRGKAMKAGIPTRGRILLTTGRISSEMVNKARSMGVPLVCSRTSPTSLSVALAGAWNITLVGYLRRTSMNIYTHPERVKTADAQ